MDVDVVGGVSEEKVPGRLGVGLWRICVGGGFNVSLASIIEYCDIR